MSDLRRIWRAVAVLGVAGALALSGAARAAGIDVRVRGLGPEERDNVYAQLGLLNYARQIDASKPPNKLEYNAEEVQTLFARGERDIRKALQPFGWYNPVVHAHLEGQAPEWVAWYEVEAGPPTVIDQLDLTLSGEGADDEHLRRLRDQPRLRLGERLKHGDYEALKTRLQQAAVAAGYLDAAYTRHLLSVDPAANSASLQLNLDTGPRYYFGDVALVQDSSLREAFLRRYVTIVADAPFDSTQVLATQFALSDLDYFQLVEVEPQKDRADARHRVPIEIRLRAKPPRAYKFGVGYGTDTGPRGLIGAEFRRINDAGHKLRIDLRPSENISTGTIEYRIPTGKKPGANLAFNLQGLSQDINDIDERLYSLGASYNQILGRYQQREYLSYTRDSFAFSGEPQVVSRLLIPGFSLSDTRGDDDIAPRNGWSGFFDVHGASEQLLSSSTFLQARVRLRSIVTPLRGWHLLLRAEEGASFVSGFEQLPPSQRFFAGGDDSVRGYSYQSLGPKDEHGNVVGGKYLTTGSVEIDADIATHYAVAVFADAGGADDTPGVRLHEGAGIGLRYRAPFGSIGVDLAHGFDADAQPVRLHINVRVGL